jgi:hypothetical protein
MSKAGRRMPSQLLRDYRAVANGTGKGEDTPVRVALRRILEENPEAFVAKMGELERAHAAASARVRVNGASPADAKPRPKHITEQLLEDLSEYDDAEPR